MAEHCSEIHLHKLFRICRSKSGLFPDQFTWSQNVRNTSEEDYGIRSRSMNSKRSRVFYVVVPQGLKSASPLLSSKSPLSLEESLTTQLPPQKCIGNFPAVDFVISSNDAIIADSNPQMQRSAPLASPQVQSPYLAISTLLRQQHCSPTKLNFLTKSPESLRALGGNNWRLYSSCFSGYHHPHTGISWVIIAILILVSSSICRHC